MTWDRNKTRFERDLTQAEDLKLRLKKQASIIPIPQKEEIFTSILHLSKQIQFYDSHGQTDGSLNRFFGNSLPLVLGHIVGDSIQKSFKDLRNTLIEIEELWEKGSATLRKHRMDLFRTLSFHFETLEMLKNASIAEQLQVDELCTQFPIIVNKYRQILSKWNHWGMIAQIRKLTLQLNQIGRVGMVENETKKELFWFHKINEIHDDIDHMEILWSYLQQECSQNLEAIITEQRLDPLTTIPFILGEIVQEFGNGQAQHIQEQLSSYFLEKRAGLNRFEIIPEELYATYEWNPESQVKSILQGERFTHKEIEEEEENEIVPIGLVISENYPLNAQQITRTCEIHCSTKTETIIGENKIHIQTLFPSKFKLEQLKASPNQITTPFFFQLKSSLLQVWGNVVKWDVNIQISSDPWIEFMEQIFDDQEGLKQSFGSDPISKIWQYYLQNAFIISYLSGEETAVLPNERIQLSVEFFEEQHQIHLEWKTILDGDNLIPSPNEKGQILLKFNLKKDYAFLYPLLSRATINEIKIQSSVLELQDLEVYNDYGKIDPSTPFNVFGTKPELGSKLFIGHPLIFCNTLEDLKINWQWFGLPDNPGGLPQYYEGYDHISYNEDFLVSVAALNAGTWVPENDKQLIPLFSGIDQTESLSSAVSNIRRVNELDLTRLQLKQKQKSFETLKEPQKSKSGYLCLELVNPLGSFGHNRYTEFVQRRMGESKKQNTFLHEPYTPLMGNLTLEAHLSEVILSKEIQERFEVSGIDGYFLQQPPCASPTVFPQDAFLSGVYLQIDQFPDGMCSLFFDLPEGISKGLQIKPKEWSIIINQNWHTLEEDQFVRDETLNFESSGLILLTDLPGAAEDNLNWLRIGSYTDTILIDRKTIKTQVVKFDITAPKGLRQIEEINEIHIPEKWSDILLSLNPLNTKKIIPPSLFFGNTHLMSIQYRLQNRIFSYQDLKHLLLIKFPKIQETLLLTHHNAESEMAPGYLRVIVIPKTEKNKLREGEWPQLNSQEIFTIKRFLEENTPMGIKISVENPVYEEIIVKGNIVIEEGIDTREARNVIHQKLLEGITEITGIIDSGFLFGQNIYSSKILVILRNISFVKSVTNFACYTRFGEYLNLPKEFNSLNYRIEPSQINHILIPGKSHLIDIKINGQHNSDGIGVSNMTLGTDFLVDRLNQRPSLQGIGKHRVGMNLMIESTETEKEQPFNQIRI